MRLLFALALLGGWALASGGLAAADEPAAARVHVIFEPGDATTSPSDPRLQPLSSRTELRAAGSGAEGFLDALEARIPFGPGPGVVRRVVVYRDAAGQPYSHLLVDANGDGALEDETPIATELRKSGTTTWCTFLASLQVAHEADGQATVEAYPLEFFVRLPSPGARPGHLGFRGKGVQTGRADLAGVRYEITISDRDNDAVFGLGDAWMMGAVRKANPDERPQVRRIGEAITAGDQSWRLDLEGTAGRSGYLVPHDGGAASPPAEDPHKAHPEDSAAPRATAPLSFVEGLDAGRAKARAEQAPYLVYFERSRDPECREMNELVFGAASVVEAARGLVCIRVDGVVELELCEKHEARRFPTGILFDPAGEELARFEGYQGIEEFETFLAEAHPHLAPSDNEPDLGGRAKRRHRKVVKEHVAFLEDGKSHGLLDDRIAVLGTQKTRGTRDALIQFASHRKSKQYIAAAFAALGRIGGARSIEFLCSKKALRSGDFLVAQKAAEALALARDPAATKTIQEVMTHRRTKIEIVAACAIALAKSDPQNDSVVETVFEYSRHKKDTIRAGAVEALGYLRSDAAVARLKDVLQNDKNTRVRCAAAWGIGHTARPELVPVLRAALEDDSSHTVRTAALDAIRELQGEER